MPKERPDHHDAELILRVYEMRRDPVMRQSRDAITRQFWPRQYEDLLAVAKVDHPLNAAFRQVSTYWEMVYGFARHGMVHADSFMESNAEGLLLLAKVQPFLERYRAEASPTAFRNAEWVATECAVGRERFVLSQATAKRLMAALAAS